jgi:signal peptidase II
MRTFSARPVPRFLLLLVLLVLADQLGKGIAVQADLPSIVHNSGWFAGVLADSVVTVRIGILIGYYCGLWVLIALFFRNILFLSRSTRFAIALFFAGINGNMIDRLRLGYVVDFIPFQIGYYRMTVNISDLFLWVGVALLVPLIVQTMRDSNLDRRGGIFVNPKLQLQLFFKMSLVFIGFAAAITGLCVILLQEHAIGHPNLLMSFIVIMGAYSFLFEAILLSVILSVTQRWLGPIYSFINFMNIDNPDYEFKVRRADEFKELEGIAKKRSGVSEKL